MPKMVEQVLKHGASSTLGRLDGTSYSIFLSLLELSYMHRLFVEPFTFITGVHSHLQSGTLAALRRYVHVMYE